MPVEGLNVMVVGAELTSDRQLKSGDLQAKLTGTVGALKAAASGL